MIKNIKPLVLLDKECNFSEFYVTGPSLNLTYHTGPIEGIW